MKLQRTISCIMGVVFAVGFAAAQASAGTEPDECNLEIEINALRGGSPTVSLGTTKNITAKARISKGTAVDGTTIDTDLTIDACDSTGCFASEDSVKNPIRLGIGKGGQGDKIGMPITRCDGGIVEFVATFTGPDPDGFGTCTQDRRITKTCK
jgi:hypothetical protein